MKLPHIQKKQPITAKFLNAQVDEINTLTGNVDAPRDPDEGGENSPEIEQTAGVWSERSRTSTTVRIEDPNDSSVYVDVARMDSVTFSTPSGPITLRFNN